jgi:hypothetical protein
LQYYRSTVFVQAFVAGSRLLMLDHIQPVLIAIAI